MALVDVYRRRFREQLSYHPVWMPGSAIAPGDVGIFRDGVFLRQANIRQLLPIDFAVTETALPNPMKFAIGVSINLHGAASGQVDPNVKVSGSLKVDRDGGVVFHARNVVQRTIDNVLPVLKAFPWDDEEWENRLFVSEVHAARSAAVMISESSGIAVEVSGKAGPLQALDLADASVGFGTTSAASYSTRFADDGKSLYPVALVIYRRSTNWLGMGKPELSSLRGPDEEAPVLPFEEVSPFDTDD